METAGNRSPRLMIEALPAGYRTRLTSCRFSFLNVTHSRTQTFADMRIELILTPSLYERRLLQERHITVAVDVLRATTAICTAFQVGAAEVVPLDSMKPLPDFLRRGYQVACERNAKKMPGATLGNSPTEYMTKDLRGARIAFSTTNGTVSILAAKDSDTLLLGSFANITALAEKLAAAGKANYHAEHGKAWTSGNTMPIDIVILCSGWKGDPCIEDTLFGGALIEKLLAVEKSLTLVNDSAMMAADLWLLAKGDLYHYVSKATHYHRLQRMNYGNDIRFALQLDTCTAVPVFHKDTASLTA